MNYWLLLFFSPLLLLAAGMESSQILFLMQKGQSKQAFALWEQMPTVQGDGALLRQMGLALLKEGSLSPDGNIQLLTALGAGITQDEETFPILERGLHSRKDLTLCLICLHQLAKMGNDRADLAIRRLLSGPSLPLALEAAFLLAENHPDNLSGQLESLMLKIPPPLTFLLPPLFAKLPDANASRQLKRFLYRADEGVVVSAIQSIAQSGRDDLGDELQRLLFHPSSAIQEAAAAATATLGDGNAVAELKQLARSQLPCVKLAALKALYHLGQNQSVEEVKNLAAQGNLFAMQLLGEMREGRELLVEMTKSADFSKKINAASSLLTMGDPDGIAPLAPFFIQDQRDFGLMQISTPGGALSCWRIIPSASEQFSSSPLAAERSLRAREELLIQASKLPEESFLPLAESLLKTEQKPLIPTLVHLLEQLETKQAISLLQRYCQKVGSPYLRQWCALALYRLRVPGPYAKQLTLWLRAPEQLANRLIDFRPLLPIEERKGEFGPPHQLTPKERSRLILECFEAFIVSGDQEGIETLIHSLHYGIPENRYLLAGILLRATQ